VIERFFSEAPPADNLTPYSEICGITRWPTWRGNNSQSATYGEANYSNKRHHLIFANKLIPFTTPQVYMPPFIQKDIGER
jgi:hypothetical protein